MTLHAEGSSEDAGVGFSESGGPPEMRTAAGWRRVWWACKEWLDGGLGLFYPPVCQLCQREPAVWEEGYVGSQCWRGVRRIERPFCDRCGLPYPGAITARFECGNCRDKRLAFASARSAVVATGVVRDVLHRYKYRRGVWFEPFLGRLLVEAAGPSLGAEGWQMLVPVPLHPVRRREREFNQAERLARWLGRVTGITVRTDLLRRVRATPSQTRLSRGQRAENVGEAFAPMGKSRLEGERVMLVDDVLTTGSTASACAGVLLELGALEVGVWTVARGV
jgi:competence protein ComFC